MASYFPSSPSAMSPLLPDRRASLDKAGVDSDARSDAVNGDPVIEQDRGVTRIEALYQAFGTGKGLAPIWMLYVSIGLISYAYSLSSNTISNFLSFATSHFGAHSLLGTIEVAIYILGAVGEFFSPYPIMLRTYLNLVFRKRNPLLPNFQI
jgi:hypothetical protein